jgi:hypothetical protein
MMSCCAVEEYYTRKRCATCPGAWRAACGKTTQQCCEGCGLATNRDVNAATNILNALRSLLNTGQRREDLRHPAPNKPGEDAADDSEDDDDSGDDSDSQGKREVNAQVHLVAPTLPLCDSPAAGGDGRPPQRDTIATEPVACRRNLRRKGEKQPRNGENVKCWLCRRSIRTLCLTPPQMWNLTRNQATLHRSSRHQRPARRQLHLWLMMTTARVQM